MFSWYLFFCAIFFNLIIIWTCWKMRKKFHAQIESLQRDHERALLLQRKSHREQIHRLQREFEKRKAEGQLVLAESILPSLDALEKAIQSVEDSELAEYTFLEGLFLVEQSFLAGLESFDIVPIQVERGAVFDPQYHESIGVEETNLFPPESVSNCLRKGWKHSSGTLRPTLVRLASSTVQQEKEPLVVESEKQVSDIAPVNLSS